MQSIVKKLTYHTRNDSFNIFPLFDIHLGARACNETLLRRDIQMIASIPNARVILGGDMIDAVTRGDAKRFNQSTLADWCADQEDVVSTQVEEFMKIIAPIYDRIDAVIEGNHERAVLKHNKHDVYGQIVKRLAWLQKREPEDLAMGVHGFLTYSFRMTYKTGGSGMGWAFKVYLNHGKGGGSTVGGHANTLKRFLDSYECDLALAGHVHGDTHARRSYYRVSDAGTIHECYSTGWLVPSYMRHRIDTAKNKRGKRMPIDTYPELAGYPPPPKIGTFQILVTPYDRDYTVSSSGGQYGMNKRLLTFLPVNVVKDNG